MKEQNKQKKKREKNPKLKVRPNWSPKKHGLQALFDEHPAFAEKLSVVEEGEPHVINLLEEVEF